MRRLLVLLLTALLLLSGCAALAEPEAPEEEWGDYQQFLPEEPQEEEPEEPAYPAAVSLPYCRNMKLDPVEGGEGFQEMVASLLYEPLFRLDEHFEPVPVLCESYAWDESGLVCTLTVREDVVFSDGSALTARDVEETLQRAMVSERYAYRLRNVASVAAGRRGQTVTVTLTAPDRGLPALLDIPIVKRTTAGERVPLGTGPYVLEGENGAESLRAREGTDLPLKTIPLVPAKDQETALYLFETRQVEMLPTDPADTPSMVSGRVQATVQPTAIMQFIGFNTGEGRPFADEALRAQLSRSIDRETLVSAQLVGLAQAAQFPVHPASPLYPKELEQPWEEVQPPAAGREPLKLLVGGGDAFRAAEARFIAGELNKLGWQITVEEQPWEAYLAALEAGEFDLYLGEVRLTADWDLTDLIGTEGTLNYGGYTRETTDILLQLFAGAENRQETAARLYSHLRSFAPIAPICFRNYTVLTYPDVVEGLAPAPSYLFQDMEQWTVRLAEEEAVAVMGENEE